MRSTVNDLLTFIEANLGVRESPVQSAIEATHRSQRSFGQPNMDCNPVWPSPSRGRTHDCWRR